MPYINQETTTTIEIDAPEGYLECKANFTLSLDTGEVTSCRLYQWDFNGRQQKRDTLVALVGHVEVNRIEELVADNYWDMEARK